jgi:hypothetical protein
MDAWASYSCTQECGLLDGCTVADGEFESIPIVVDAMGATLRWQDGSDMVFLHNGGTGTAYATGILVDESIAAGHGVAVIKWDAGAMVGDVEMGWATRPGPEAMDLRRLSARVATVARWVSDELADGQFGTAGCSAGSFVTFAARAWHGLDDLLDYQLFVGGPPFHDLGWACGDETSPGGRCTADPSAACASNEDCGANGQCAPYANSTMAPIVELTDSTHLTAPDCASRVRNPAWDASRLMAEDADLNNEHPVDFLINVGPGPSDVAIGVYPHARDLADALTGGGVGWHEEPGFHCQGFGSATAWDLLRGGMGWD